MPPSAGPAPAPDAVRHRPRTDGGTGMVVSRRWRKLDGGAISGRTDTHPAGGGNRQGERGFGGKAVHPIGSTAASPASATAWSARAMPPGRTESAGLSAPSGTGTASRSAVADGLRQHSGPWAMLGGLRTEALRASGAGAVRVPSRPPDAWLPPRPGRTVPILADVHVKFGAHAITADRTITEQATDAEWFGADVLIATGQRTGSPTQPEEVEQVRAGTHLPVIVGSGLNPEQVPTLMGVADGAIVGQWLKKDAVWWNPVDRPGTGRLRPLSPSGLPRLQRPRRTEISPRTVRLQGGAWRGGPARPGARSGAGRDRRRPPARAADRGRDDGTGASRGAAPEWRAIPVGHRPQDAQGNAVRSGCRSRRRSPGSSAAGLALDGGAGGPFLRRPVRLLRPGRRRCLPPRWDCCRPPRTASRCAKVVVMQATEAERTAGWRMGWSGVDLAKIVCPAPACPKGKSLNTSF